MDFKLKDVCTVANILMALYAVVLSFEGRLELAAWVIFAAWFTVFLHHDVIVEAADRPVPSARLLQRMIGDSDQSSLKLKVVRKGKARTVWLKW